MFHPLSDYCADLKVLSVKMILRLVFKLSDRCELHIIGSKKKTNQYYKCLYIGGIKGGFQILYIK
jgi:hypothetical protein